jgi:hypothetical protein
MLFIILAFGGVMKHFSTILVAVFFSVVNSACAQPGMSSGASGVRDFDLQSDFSDPNGYPRNPAWRWQLRDENRGKIPDPSTLCPNGLPNSGDCTSQKTWENLPHLPKVLVCMWQLDSSLIGHINWTPLNI